MFHKIYFSVTQKRGFTPCTHAPSLTQTRRGFTLSELLISLAVLGLISALTLPTIVNNVNKARNDALFKESFTALSTAVMEGVQTGMITDAGNTSPFPMVGNVHAMRAINYIATKMNATPYNYNVSGYGYPADNTTGLQTFQLPNGVVIRSFHGGHHAYDNRTHFVIDINGIAPPNNSQDSRTYEVQWGTTGSLRQGEVRFMY